MKAPVFHGPAPTDTLERFLRFLPPMPQDDSCWVWKGRTSPPYGSFDMRIRAGEWKEVKAHQFSYKMFVGEVPKGWHIDHLCRNTLCVNPKHLEAVTPRVNILRGISRSAQNARKTHCDHGHEFTEENTTYRPQPNGLTCRVCRRCAKDRARAQKRRPRPLRDTPCPTCGQLFAGTSAVKKHATRIHGRCQP